MAFQLFPLQAQFLLHLADRLLEEALPFGIRQREVLRLQLPHAPDAVRIAFYQYRFASVQAHAQDGVYWERELLGALPERSCR